MKIKKIEQSVGVMGKILNSKGTSKENTYSCEYLNKITDYSTEEKRIGTWINGKPIYRKTIIYKPSTTIGAASTTTNIEIPHGISNVDTFINKTCIDSFGIMLPHVTANGNGFTFLVGTASNTSITLRIINDTWTSRNWYITLEYTKTTD